MIYSLYRGSFYVWPFQIGFLITRISSYRGSLNSRFRNLEFNEPLRHMPYASDYTVTVGESTCTTSTDKLAPGPPGLFRWGGQESELTVTYLFNYQ